MLLLDGVERQQLKIVLDLTNEHRSTLDRCQSEDLRKDENFAFNSLKDCGINEVALRRKGTIQKETLHV